MQPEIIVTINSQGEITTEVKGMTGRQCVEVTKFIDMLGEFERTTMPEYFQSARQKLHQHIIIDP